MNSIPSINVQSCGNIPTPKGVAKIDAGISVLYYLAKAMEGKLKLEKKACKESVKEQTIQSMIEKAVQNANGITAKENLLEFFRKLLANTKDCDLLKGWITGYYDSIVNYQNKIGELLSKYKDALAKLNREENIASGVEAKAAAAKGKMNADQKEAAKYWKLAKENWKHPIKAAYYTVEALRYEAKASVQATAYAADETTIKFLNSEIVKALRLVEEAKDKYQAKKDELIANIRALMANSNNISPQQLQQLQQDFNDLLTTLHNEANNNPFMKAIKWLSNAQKYIEKLEKKDKDVAVLDGILNFLAFGPVLYILHQIGFARMEKAISNNEKTALKNGDIATYWVDKGLNWFMKNMLANISFISTAKIILSGFDFVGTLPGRRLTKAMTTLAQDGQKFIQAQGAVDQLVDIMSKISANKLAQAIEFHKQAVNQYLTSSSDVELISNILEQSSTNSVKA